MTDIEDAEDRGYKNAINDVLEWHNKEILALTTKAKEAFVTGPGERSIHIGAVWEGKLCSATQLMDLAIILTECAKTIQEKFQK